MSAWEGSQMQMEAELERERRARVGVCKGAYALGTACGRCDRCDVDPANPRNARRATSGQVDGHVGTRRVSIELSEADLRRLVNASPAATVEVLRDPGPTGVDVVRVLVSWTEAR